MTIKIIETFSPESVASIEPGDSVGLRFVRGPNFQSYTADMVVLLSQVPSHMTLSISRSEPREVMSVGVLGAADGRAFSFALTGATANTVNVEEAQVRLSPEIAVELAVTILNNAVSWNRTFVTDSVKANEALHALFDFHE